MRLATVATEHGPALAFEIEAGIFTFRQALDVLERSPARKDAGATGMLPEARCEPAVLDDIHALIDGGEPALRFASRVIEAFAALGEPAVQSQSPVSRDALLAPIVRPRKNIFCVGRNYADHAKERGADVPTDPVFFTKAPTTVVGPDAQVPLPPQTAQFDYEGELAVIIGKRGRDIPKAEAHEYIFGYTILNDLTARDLQSRHLQFFKGKSLDQSCPMGPVIVTDGLTLEPGDIIATGTPSGVGSATGRFLAKGDVVTVSITSLGTLTTYIV